MWLKVHEQKSTRIRNLQSTMVLSRAAASVNLLWSCSVSHRHPWSGIEWVSRYHPPPNATEFQFRRYSGLCHVEIAIARALLDLRATSLGSVDVIACTCNDVKTCTIVHICTHLLTLGLRDAFGSHVSAAAAMFDNRRGEDKEGGRWFGRAKPSQPLKLAPSLNTTDVSPPHMS